MERSESPQGTPLAASRRLSRIVPGWIIERDGLGGVHDDLLGLGHVLGFERLGALRSARGGDVADDPVPGVLGRVLLDQEPDGKGADPGPEREIDRPAMERDRDA
jgi:hypothetical protein